MSCTVFPKDQSSFSNTSRICSHSTVGHESAGRAQSNRPIHPRYNVRPTDKKYFHFSQHNPNPDLNERHEDREDVSVFPRNIYAKHPFGSSVSYLIQPRDRNSHYTFSSTPHPRNDRKYIKEKSEHSLWHSVYGYDRFHNEYGVGVQSRGYIEPWDCHDCHQDIPKDMAPKRFYSDKHLKSSTSEFRDDIDDFSTPICAMNAL